MSAPKGKLTGKKENIDGEIKYVFSDELELNITFPDLSEESKQETINAIISAATLDGKQFAGTIEPKTAARMLLAALGEHDVDEMIDQLFPDQMDQSTEDAVQEALTEIKAFLGQLKESLID